MIFIEVFLIICFMNQVIDNALQSKMIPIINKARLEFLDQLDRLKIIQSRIAFVIDMLKEITKGFVAFFETFLPSY